MSELKDINKPVMVIMAGPSIAELEENIESFRDIDCYWVTVNKNQYNLDLEDKILAKIGKKIDYVFDHNKHAYADVGSLCNCVIHLMRNGATSIYLFGADGGQIPSYPNLYHGIDRTKIKDITADAEKMNNNFKEWALTKIINSSMESNYTCFEKKPYAEIIKEVQSLFKHIPIIT